MSEESPEPKHPRLPWNEIPELAETNTGDLLAQLSSLDSQIEALQVSREQTRSALSQLISRTTYSVTGSGLLVRWAPEGKPGVKLDRAKLVQAGVMPDQLKAGEVPTKGKAAHLDVRKLESSSSSPQSDSPS